MDARSRKLWERGIGHFRLGNLEAAQASFETFLAREPGQAGPARFRLSIVHARRGRYRKAIALAQEALLEQPGQVEVLSHLARCHLMAGEPELARSLAMRALALPRDNPVVLDSLGVVMTRLDEQVLAIELFDHAISLAPGQASMFFNRALAHKQFSHVEAARSDLETCIVMNPAHAKAHWNLSDLERQEPDSNHAARLQDRLATAPCAPSEEELLSLALFKELDDIGDTPAATVMLGRGIATRAGRWKAAPRPMRGSVDALIDVCDADFLAARRGGITASPLFVFGMPRSGVQLLGNLLSRHARIHQLGFQQAFARLLWQQIGREPPGVLDAPTVRELAKLDFDLLGKQYVAAVTPPADSQLIVCESQPMNFMLAGLIARALPGARFVHVSRDAVDNCVSILGHPGGETSLPSHDASELAAYYRQYYRLLEHWRAQISDRIHELRYENLVTTPETVLRDLCDFLGVRFPTTLRTGLDLKTDSIGRGQRYLEALPGLANGLGMHALR